MNGLAQKNKVNYKRLKRVGNAVATTTKRKKIQKFPNPDTRPNTCYDNAFNNQT